MITDRAFLDALFWVSDEEDQPCYGIKLCEALMHICFKHMWSINLSVEVNRHVFEKKGVDNETVWAKGACTGEKVMQARTFGQDLFQMRRIFALRTILVLLSQALYFKPEEYLTILNPFFAYFTMRRAPFMKNLFFSLLNTVTSYDTHGLLGVGIPYVSSSDTFVREVKFMESVLSVFNVMMEYRPPTKDNVKFLIDGGFQSLKAIRDHFVKNFEPDGDEKPSAAEIEDLIHSELSTNEWYRLVQVIHGKTNLEPITTGFTNLAYNFVEHHNSFLPESVSVLPFYDDALITFWRFLHGNPHMLEEIVSDPQKCEKLTQAVLLCFSRSLKDPQKSNLLYVCVFILLTLSSSREYSINLNEPYNLKLPFEIQDFTPSSHANLLIQVIYQAVRVGPRVLQPLYKSLISIISNIAPYAKNLTKESCEAIMELLKRFSKSDFLRESEGNCKIVSNLFEAINYIL